MTINRTERFTREYYALVPDADVADLVEIIVPAKTTMRLLDYGNFCGTPAAWGFVYWNFYHDDKALYPYELVYDRVSFGTGRQFVQPVEIHGGHRFRVRANNPTAADCRMGVSLCWEFEYQE